MGKGIRHLDSGEVEALEGLPPTVVALDYTLQWFPLLRFVSDTAEDLFCEFMSPKVSPAFVVLYVVAIFLYVIQLFSTPALRTDIALIPLAVFSVVHATLVGLHRTRRVSSSRLVGIEDLAAACSFVFVATYFIVVTYVVLSEDCEAQGVIPLDGRKHFETANCFHVVEPFPILLLLCFQYTGRYRFSRLALGTALQFVLLVALWPVSPALRRRSSTTVPIVCAFNGIAFALILVIRYGHEATQRKQFISYHTLKCRRAELEEGEAKLDALCRQILPHHLFSKLASRPESRDALAGSTLSGTVLIAAVPDFERWSQTQPPPMIAIAASASLDALTKHFETSSPLSRVASLGDQVILVGGLLNAMPSSLPACSAALGAHKHIRFDKHMPLTVAIARGALQGALVGTKRIRYDVYGSALDDARQILPLASADCPVVLSEALAAYCESEVQVERLVSADDGGCGAYTLLAMRSDVSELQVPADMGPPVGIGAVESLFESEEPSGRWQKDQPQPKHPQDLSERLDMMPVWQIYRILADPEAEEAFWEERLLDLKGAAAVMWMCYAVFVCGVLFLVLIDLSGHTKTDGGVSVAMLIVGGVASVVEGFLASSLSQQSFSQHFGAWSIAGLLIPLLVVFGCAAARPATLGNDVRGVVLVGSLMRTYCFKHVRHQAAGMPLLMLVAQLHVLLPGGAVRLTTPSLWLCVLFIVLFERERDLRAREAFCVKHRARHVSKLLSQHKQLCENLMYASVPKPILKFVSFGGVPLGKGGGLQVPNTVVIAVQYVPPMHDGVVVNKSSSATSIIEPTADSSFDVVSDLVDKYERVSFVSIWGDLATIAGPLTTEMAFDSLEDESEKAALEATQLIRDLHAACDTSSNKNMLRVVAEVDSTIQIQMHTRYTTFSVYGPAMRVRTMLSGADRYAFGGVAATERFKSTHEGLGTWSLMPPLRIRGIGMVRLWGLTTTGMAV